MTSPVLPPPVMPYLYYADAAQALEFLVEVFGFEEHEVTRGTDGAVWTAQLRTRPGSDAGMVLIGPGMAEFGSRSVDESELATSRAHVLVDDLAAHYERAVTGGAVIHMEPTAGFGGGRLYVAGDCGGQQWIFTEARPA